MENMIIYESWESKPRKKKFNKKYVIMSLMAILLLLVIGNIIYENKLTGRVVDKIEFSTSSADKQVAEDLADGDFESNVDVRDVADINTNINSRMMEFDTPQGKISLEFDLLDYSEWVESEVENEEGAEDFDILVNESAEKYKWGYDVRLNSLEFMARIDVSISNSENKITLIDNQTLKIGENYISFADLTSQGYSVTIEQPVLLKDVNLSVVNETIVNITEMNVTDIIINETNISMSPEVNETDVNASEETNETGVESNDSEKTINETINERVIVDLEIIGEEPDGEGTVIGGAEEPTEEDEGEDTEGVDEEEVVEEDIIEEETVIEEVISITGNFIRGITGFVVHGVKGITGMVIGVDEQIVSVYVQRDFSNSSYQIGDVINLDPIFGILAAGDNGTATDGNIVYQCGTINQSGSFVMNQSINTTGTCLTIQANNITLDMNGFNITGDATGFSDRNDYGVFSDGYDNLTVYNGLVDRVFYGFRISNGGDINLTNLTVTGAEYGFSLTNVDVGYLTDLNASNNVMLDFGGYPIVISATSSFIELDGLDAFNNDENIQLYAPNSSYINITTNDDLYPSGQYSNYTNITVTEGYISNPGSNSVYRNINVDSTTENAMHLGLAAQNIHIIGGNMTTTSGYGVFITNPSGASYPKNNVFEDVYIKGDTADVGLGGDSDPDIASRNHSFINCTYASEVVGPYAELNKKWHYQAHVNDTGGNVVPGATIAVYDKDNVLRESWMTNSSGNVIGNLREYLRVGGTKTYYANYTIYAYNDTHVGNMTINVTTNFMDEVITVSLDNNKPNVFGINVSESGNDMLVSWNTSEPANSSVNYGETTSLGNISNSSTFEINRSIAIGGLNQNTLYYYNISSCDFVGNCNITGTYNFTAFPDYDAPNISGINTSEFEGSVIVSWNTNEPANSSVNYGTTTSLGSLNSSSILTTNLSISLNGLNPGTLYYYNLTSCDSAGNCNTTGTYNFTAFEITSCRTFSSPNTDYILTQNLSTIDDCFYIGAHNVTIDLNGYTIEGYGGVGDYGVDNTGTSSERLYDGLVVKNGHIKDFEIGIYQEGSFSDIPINSQFINLTISSTVTATFIAQSFGFYGCGNNMLFENLTIRDLNALTGSIGSASGIVFEGCGRNSRGTNFNNIVIENITATRKTTRAGVAFGFNLDGAIDINITNANISGISGETSTEHFRLVNTINLSCLNCTYDSSLEDVDSNSDLTRKWYYRAHTEDTSGTNVSNATVDLYNGIDANPYITLTTNSSGWTNTTNIIDYVNNGGTKTYYDTSVIAANYNLTLWDDHIYNVTDEQNNLNDSFVLDIDITPPVFGGYLVSMTTGTTDNSYVVVINWTTDDPSNSSVIYWGASSGSGGDNVMKVNNHGVIFSGLMNNSNYNFNYTSCDFAGNCNTSSGSFVTLDPGVADIPPSGSLSCVSNWQCDVCISPNGVVGDNGNQTCIDINECNSLVISKTQPCKVQESYFAEDEDETPFSPGFGGPSGSGGPRTGECNSNFECSEWSACQAVYDLEDIIEEKVLLDGERQRKCVDKNNCEYDKFEREECVTKLPVYAKKVFRCNDNYIEIYDSKDILISRMKLVDGLYQKLDVQMLFDEFGYCPYCYDGQKNYEEDEIDCQYSGVDCPRCSLESPFLRANYGLILIIFIGLTLLSFMFIIWYLLLWKKRKKWRKRLFKISRI